MIDEQKRKILIYAGIGFAILVVISLIAYGILNRDSDLPPIEDAQSSSTTEPDESDPSAADTTEDEVPITRDGVLFYRFGELQQHAITSTRIDVILLTLARYAKANDITEYTFDQSTLQKTTEGERHIYTFEAAADTSKRYKVELSYIYSADAFVRIFDGDTVVETSY